MRVTADEINAARDQWPWEAIWDGEDCGLIAAWESGRKMARFNPELAAATARGELLILGWKGGVERVIKARKFGSLKYVAMWRGLRGEALDMDTEEACRLTCTRTGMTVDYTADVSLLMIPGE